MPKIWSGDDTPEPDWSGGDTEMGDWHDTRGDEDSAPTPEPDWTEDTGDDAPANDEE